MLDFIIGSTLSLLLPSYRLILIIIFCSRLHPYVVDRFKKAFNESNNSLITIKNTHFVLLNSMTLSRDGCYFCAESEAEIRRISKRLKCAKQQSQSKSCKDLNDRPAFYAKPVLLQHFPTFRRSDEDCEEHDSLKIEEYRESWEVLSKDATEFLGKALEPMVAFSGHSHHYCRSYNMWSVEEFTIASFSWRNKRNPSFLLVRYILWIAFYGKFTISITFLHFQAEFSQNDYAVSKCDMPNENTVIFIYIISGISVLLTILGFIFLKCCSKKLSEKIQ